jgi:hypothetical protein
MYSPLDEVERKRDRRQKRTSSHIVLWGGKEGAPEAYKLLQVVRLSRKRPPRRPPEADMAALSSPGLRGHQGRELPFRLLKQKKKFVTNMMNIYSSSFKFNNLFHFKYTVQYKRQLYYIISKIQV